MRFISWNVNGLRACLNKGFMDYFNDVNADIFCMQEIKMNQDQASIETPGYFQYFNSAQKKGYSGTAVFSKIEPNSVYYGINGLHADEGRVLTLEFDKFYLVNSYSPNAQKDLARIDYRVEFEDSLRNYLVELNQKKSVLLCGDLNVAHKEIDLKNPKSNVGNPGFSDQERNKFTELLDAGFTDSFRYFYPDKELAYSWWSYRFSARSKNIGWRIDYYVVSNDIKENLKDAFIHDQILGSDHCPVGIDIDL